MGMTGTGMGTAVHTALLNMNVGGGQTLGSLLTASQSDAVKQNWIVICEAIVAYIQTNALVTKLHVHADPVSGFTSVPNVNEVVQ